MLSARMILFLTSSLPTTLSLSPEYVPPKVVKREGLNSCAFFCWENYGTSLSFSLQPSPSNGIVWRLQRAGALKNSLITVPVRQCTFLLLKIRSLKQFSHLFLVYSKERESSLPQTTQLGHKRAGFRTWVYPTLKPKPLPK